MDLFWLGGEGFKDIPHWAYLYLVTTMKVPPENLAGLRSVERVGFWDGKLVTFFRIYDPRISEQKLQVKDFTSLGRHPELILYEGYWEKDSNRVSLTGKAAPTPPQEESAP